MNSFKKLLSLTTVLAVSITVLSTISVSAKSIKIPRVKVTELQSVKPGKLTIKIKKVKKCTGYKVKISQNIKFKKSKTYEIQKNQKTVKGLKQGKKYFVKARAYKKIKVKGKSKTVYGKWSKVKSMIIKANKIDKMRREQVKDLIGIKFSENVHFFNYSFNPYWYEEYDNDTGTYVRYEDPIAGYIVTKIRIKESELKKIIENIGFYKQSKSSIPPGIKFGYDCDWWDLKESQIKSFYDHPHSLDLANGMRVKTVWQYIIVASEKDSDGYLTVYMYLV